MDLGIPFLFATVFDKPVKIHYGASLKSKKPNERKAIQNREKMIK